MNRLIRYTIAFSLCLSLGFMSLAQASPMGIWCDSKFESEDPRHRSFKSVQSETNDWGRLDSSLQHLPPQVFKALLNELDDQSIGRLMQTSRKMRDLVIFWGLQMRLKCIPYDDA